MIRGYMIMGGACGAAESAAGRDEIFATAEIFGG
jgi:hypothetical protein